MSPGTNSYSEEDTRSEGEQSAGLSTAESECPGSKCSMEREGGDACRSDHGKAESNSKYSLEEEISNISNEMKMTSFQSKTRRLSLSGSSKSLTCSAPTILVNTPDDNSYHTVHRPLRSSMSSRTLHESLHRGKPALKKTRSQSVVSFDQVNIREYERILGDNPSCTSGPPLSIGWKFSPSPMVISVDDYESGKGDIPRYKSQFLVPKDIREKMLKEHAGVSRREIVATVRGIQKQKSQRRKTAANLGMQNTEEKVENVRRTVQKAMGKRKPFSKEEKRLWDDAHERAVEKAKQLENSIRNGESISLRNVYSVGTPANCMLPSRRSLRQIETGPSVRDDEGEAKEEEETPTSIDHEIVSEGAVRDPDKIQDPAPEQLRRSIVIEEDDNDDIFEKLELSLHQDQSLDQEGLDVDWLRQVEAPSKQDHKRRDREASKSVDFGGFSGKATSFGSLDLSTFNIHISVFLHADNGGYWSVGPQHIRSAMSSNNLANARASNRGASPSTNASSQTYILFVVTCLFVSMTGNFLHHRLADPHNVHKHAMRQFEMTHLGGHVKLDEQKKKQSASKLKSATTASGEKPPPPVHDLAGLSCSDHGGPSDDLAQEMIYWSDIPSDDKFVSPIGASSKKRKYLTFEPDGGGFNNIRMSMETMIIMAHSMSRTLVMPPSQGMYLLRKDRGKQRVHFSFDDFYHLEQVGYEHAGLHVISMEDFLKTEAMTGNLVNKTTGDVAFPPNNQTNWDGFDPKPLKEYLRDVTLTPLNWNPGSCLVAFPSDDGPEHFAELDEMMKAVNSNFPKLQEFIDKPVPVDAPTTERLREAVAGRIRNLCVYDEEMQEATIIHFMCYHKMRVRFLTHFYAFLFFESWEQDLFYKRFVRDHLRYSDEIQCAAARVVAAIRDRARRRDPTGNPDGEFDSFHIRRGDFQYKNTRLEADQIYDNAKDKLKEKATVFVATDHQQKPFFKPLADHFDLVFLSDFKEELKNVNTNYFGMIDQLVASRGRVFFGCFHSTFSGFIFRVRGYHSQKDKTEGWERGVLPDSYYYSGKNEKSIYQTYGPLKTPFYSREFPISWRDIDKGIEELSAL